MTYNYEELRQKCKEIRLSILESIHSAGKGHVGGSFSIVEALVCLYYEKMNIDPQNPALEKRDRFVLSKGHAGPALYAVLADKGYFPKSWLLTLNKPNTNLPSHVDMNKTPGVDMTAGSLGQGISAAVGMALGSRILNDGATIYAIIGDGESQEGQVWEAAMQASARGLDNLIVFLDYNKQQLDGSLEDVLPAGDVVAKWRAFGFHTVSIDGHDIKAISEAIDVAKAQQNSPSMIILNTIKGKGVRSIEAMGYMNHSMAVTDELLAQAKQELQVTLC